MTMQVGMRFGNNRESWQKYLTKGEYTLFEQYISLDKLAMELEQLPKDKFPDSIRIHIPRILRATYDIRSNRPVAHILISASQKLLLCWGWYTISLMIRE